MDKFILRRFVILLFPFPRSNLNMDPEMSVSVWNKRINLWLQVKYSILCMNNVVLLCFLFINPGFCLRFCQSIPWHTLWQTWLFFFFSAFIARHETCHLKLPKIYLAIICDSQDMMLKRTSKSVSLGMPISCLACRTCQTNWLHDLHARHAKPEEQKLGMNYQPGERSGT